MDGGGTRFHIVEVVTAPSPLRTRRQPTRVDQLCWARIWLIHQRCMTASSSRRRGGIRLGDWRRSRYTYNGHQGYPQSTGSNEPGPMAGRPKLGWQESAHGWAGTVASCRAAAVECFEWSLVTSMRQQTRAGLPRNDSLLSFIYE
jgi:hypothetical protein